MLRRNGAMGRQAEEGEGEEGQQNVSDWAALFKTNPLPQLDLLNLIPGGSDDESDQSDAMSAEGTKEKKPGDEKRSVSKLLDYYWSKRMDAVIAAEKMVEAAKAKALEIDRKTDDMESKVRSRLQTAKSEVTRIVSAQRFRSLKWSHSANLDKDDLEQTMLYFHEKLDDFESKLALARPLAPQTDFGSEFDEVFRRKVHRRNRRSSLISVEEFGRLQDSKALVEDYDSPGGSNSDHEADKMELSNKLTSSRRTFAEELGDVNTPEDARHRLKLIRRDLELRLHDYSSAANFLEKTDRHHGENSGLDFNIKADRRYSAFSNNAEMFRKTNSNSKTNYEGSTLSMMIQCTKYF
eukprot:747103-Hanusia_phi.AAC.3